jgi:hypothetical protein
MEEGEKMVSTGLELWIVGDGGDVLGAAMD